MDVEGAVFYEIASGDPGRVAFAGAGERVTYGQVHDEVNRLTRALRRLGLGVGDTVATLLGNRREFLTVLLAGAQAGFYIVPVSRHLKAPEIAYILADSAAKVLVTEHAYAGEATAAADEAGLARDVRVSVDAADGYVGLDALLSGESPQPPDGRVMGTLMLYTSGTTGRPKGVRRPLVEISPELLFTLLLKSVGGNLGLEPGDEVHLAVGPLYHSAPCVHALMALNLGHTVVVSEHFDPEQTLDLIERHRVTNTFMVPTMFHRMLALPKETRDRYDLSSLRQVFHSAAPVPVDTKRRMLDWWGPVIHEYYGSTESGPVVVAGPREWLRHPGTVGRAVPGHDVKIFDESGTELPPGEPGMIYVRGHTPFEYHGDPGKTARSMLGEYYTPGDIGHLDEDGWLYMSDRRTDLIISGGVNIYPAEVESVLLQHPAVADVAVIGVQDDEWGQKVVALVEPVPDAVPGDALADEILAHCESRLARLKHPRELEFRTSLPRTPAGKLSRGRVRDAYLREKGG
ncbi:AMP-binding protein [Spirillospora sp. CA-294931]|uniref:AMP-binding protein n=1 Tax=Spirillospora sp. CA-294931 TaxID=3240042 RepID=UPI003D9238DA